jgi:hypothetical protein
MMGGSSSPSTNTVTSSQEIPAFEQQASQQNQALAQSIASQPYPTYQGALIQPMDALQTQGENQAVTAATAYQPYLNAATGATGNALNPSGVDAAAGQAASTVQGVNALAGGAANVASEALNPSGVNAYSGAATGELGNALATNAATPGAIQSYMNPYTQAALAPSIQDLQLQEGQQQQAINTNATQDAAFGDARQGSAQALQNLYGNQALNQLTSTAENNAYTQAQSALATQQQAGLTASGQLGNLAQLQNTEQGTQLSGANALLNAGGLLNTGANTLLNAGGLLNTEQGTQLTGANQLASLGGQAQSLGETGAGATYTAGQQQQTQGQTELNAAYQQYLNQINFPLQMLNVQESALSNSPYNIATAVTLPSGNAAAQGFGALTGLAGLLGGSSGTSSNVFGSS